MKIDRYYQISQIQEKFEGNGIKRTQFSHSNDKWSIGGEIFTEGSVKFPPMGLKKWSNKNGSLQYSLKISKVILKVLISATDFIFLWFLKT